MKNLFVLFLDFELNNIKEILKATGYCYRIIENKILSYLKLFCLM